MHSHLDVKLTETMQNYLHMFFHSLQGDAGALNSFVSTLSSFHNTIRTNRDNLHVETLGAVQGFASVIDIVASDVLELETLSDKLSSEIEFDISKILDETLTIDDERRPKLPNGPSSQPAYIKPCYEWLLSNLHNPYPSKELKKTIARQSKCSPKDVDSWFIDARKRIGWNTLRRELFSNKQDKIIAAAARFFKPQVLTFTDDLGASLESEADVNDAYHAKFTSMEAAARSLYSGRFSDVSSSISALSIRDQRLSSRSSRNSHKGSEARKRASSSHSADAGNELHVGAPSPILAHDMNLPYPTPQPSPGQSVELSSPTSMHLPLPIHPDTLTRKRRQMSFKEGLGDDLVLPRKRSRPNDRGSTDSTEITDSVGLPSPAPTIDFSEDTPESSPQPTDCTSCSATPTAVQAKSGAKRKRRLSGGESRRPAKRPHHALAVPRLQAVSDPFPIPRPFMDDSIDEWFYNNFSAERQLSAAIPSSASLDAHDLPVDVPLEVHCNISPYQFTVAPPQISFLAQVSPEETPVTNEASQYATPESLLTPNSLPEVNTAEIASADELSLPSDFKFPFTVEKATSQDIPFNSLDQILDLGSFLQLPSTDFNWMQLPLSGSVNVVEPSTSYMTENPIIFDSIIHQDSIIPEDQATKRLRLQFLREELQLLESEIGP